MNAPTVTAGKYLTFFLAGEEYALEIEKIKEIIELMPFTKVPIAPDYVRGVINLRGSVVPVIELRKKLGIAATEDTKETCIIVAETIKNNARAFFGFIVDSVSEVMEILSGQIEPAPDFGIEIDASVINGLAKTKDSVKILLNIDRLLSGDSIINNNTTEVTRHG